jgi:hypothetical protein
MRSARYGHMRLGFCLRMNYGHIGCSVDVLPLVDRQCSARRSCALTVLPENILSITSRHLCTEDLKSFLEVRYECVKGKLVNTLLLIWNYF